MQPTVGRIVRFIKGPDEPELAAIVTGANEDHSLNLQVLRNDGGGPLWVRGVPVQTIIPPFTFPCCALFSPTIPLPDGTIIPGPDVTVRDTAPVAASDTDRQAEIQAAVALLGEQMDYLNSAAALHRADLAIHGDRLTALETDIAGIGDHLAAITTEGVSKPTLRLTKKVVPPVEPAAEPPVAETETPTPPPAQ